MSGNHSRRIFLKTAGAATVLAAGGATWRANDQSLFSPFDGTEYEGWREWRTASGGPLHFVRASILAANPHNSQPWLFRITGGNVDLFADPRRNIGAIDPLLREMHIGLGCALENLVIAAEANGYESEVRLFPNPSLLTHVARVFLTPSSKRSAGQLYEAIGSRHTNRGPYSTTRQLSLRELDSLGDSAKSDSRLAVRWLRSTSELTWMRQTILQACKAIVADRQQAHDSFQWIRHGADEIRQTRSGITIDALGLSPFLTAAIKMMPRPDQTRVDEGWLRATRDQHLATASVFGVILAPSAHNRHWQMATGRFWERLHLLATMRGIALHPLSQITERIDRELTMGSSPRFGAAGRELSGGRGEVMMIFRAGFPMHEASPSPRRSVEDVVLR